MRRQIRLGPLFFLVPGLVAASACSSSSGITQPRELFQQIWDKAHPELKLPADVNWPWQSSVPATSPAPKETPVANAQPQNAPPPAAAPPDAPTPAEEPTLLRGTITSRHGSVAMVANNAGDYEIVRPGDRLKPHWRIKRIEPESAVLVSETDHAQTRRIFLVPLESLPSHR